MLPPDPRGEERKLSAGENQPHIDTNEACRVSYTQECCVQAVLVLRAQKWSRGES